MKKLIMLLLFACSVSFLDAQVSDTTKAKEQPTDVQITLKVEEFNALVEYIKKAVDSKSATENILNLLAIRAAPLYAKPKKATK